MTGMSIECPYCKAELLVEGESAPCVCEQCQHELDARGQLAYARGQSAFLQAQEAMEVLFDRKRHPKYGDEQHAVIRVYQQAHSALEVALQGDLEDGQRLAAIEMMAAMARLFVQRSLASSLEASYWGNLLIEENTWRECEEIDRRLADPSRHGFGTAIWRLRWRLRRGQLIRGLRRLDRVIGELEQMIAFVDPPRARKGRPRLS